MIRKPILLAAVILTLATHSTLAQTGADILEKAIFAHETQRNYSETLELYNEVISTAKVQAKVGAEAYFRKGLILKQQGKTEEANEAFRIVISDYPSIEKLVSAARNEQTIGQKWKKPWEHGELHEYDLAMKGFPKRIIGHQWSWIEEKNDETVFHSMTSMGGVVYNFSRISADPITFFTKN